MKKAEEIPTTSANEVEEVIKRLENNQLGEKDKQLVVRLLRMVLMLLGLVETKNATIAGLKKLLFGSGKDPGKKPDNQAPITPEQEASSEAQSSTPQSNTTLNNNAEDKKRKGHGRLAASAYSGAKVVSCDWPMLIAGKECPQPACGGHLYDPTERQRFVRFESRPLIDATIYEQAVLRCQKCQARFSAPLPVRVPAEKFAPSADVVMAILKYGAGLPFYRLEKLQALMGIPLPASTQFMRCEEVANRVMPIYLELARLASTGEVLHGDDTGVKILSCLAENKQLAKDARTGLQTTGIGAMVGQQTIALYYSGRRHTGENLYQLLQQRPKHLGLPAIMADAAAKNWTPEYQGIICKCLQHARKNFQDIQAAFVDKSQHVLDALGEVYKNDAVTRAMTATQRLAYHAQYSLPIMNELKQWLEQQLATREVELNDGFGKAIKYFITHFTGLTQFCRVVNALLDNNLAERILKRAVLNRKNSLFYKTEHGAAVGDIITSLIQSCALAKVNVFDYLLTLLGNGRAVRSEPDTVIKVKKKIARFSKFSLKS